MGVHGLWKLIDRAGKPIPVETLENKILAVDVSIWLYQLVRGFQESTPVRNAFLLGLFRRICKLLFFRIKPIFVFDGGVPALKRKTIAARQRSRLRSKEAGEKLRQQLLENLVKQQALGDVLGERVHIPKMLTQSKEDSLFYLPPLPEKEEKIDDPEGGVSSDDDDYMSSRASFAGDITSVNVKSEEFLSLPADIRHDILTELKETRKLNSWARIHLMPEESDDFSSFQMERLLKRRTVQVELEKAEGELGTRGLTLNDLKNILTAQGVEISQRIAKDNTTRYVYASNLQDLKDNEKPSSEESPERVSELRRSPSPSYSPSPTVSSPSESEEDEPKVDESSQVEKMAQRESLSQSEILEIIKQQSPRKVSNLNLNRPGSSKEPVSFNPPEEKSKSVASDDSEEEAESTFDEFNTVVEKDSLNDTVKSISEVKVAEPENIESFKVNGESDTKSKSAIEIVINPNEAPPEDDFFADIFCEKPKSPMSKESPDTSGLEIVINKDEPPEDDFFADVFDSSREETSKDPVKTANEPVQSDHFKKPDNAALRMKRLQTIKEKLEKESEILMEDSSRERKLASTITEQITCEAQELLHLFGIPYIIAPMEAEAQCAYLDLTGQTEGTITDDSDIWLFGAGNVYKNFFDQKKFVKQFKASDILQCYRLTREDLIMIALLVGSDYTTGLPGVGPVNAIEIVAHFPQKESLKTPEERLKKFLNDYLDSKLHPNLARKLKSIELAEGFPSSEVVRAYLAPVVDESKEKFTWSDPNELLIRKFARDKFGWDTNKTDEVLRPVLEKINQKTTQKTLHNYFDWAFTEEESAKVSKRVGAAVSILTGETKLESPKTSSSSSKPSTSSSSSSNRPGRSNKRPKKPSAENDAPPSDSVPPEPANVAAGVAERRSVVGCNRKRYDKWSRGKRDTTESDEAPSRPKRPFVVPHELPPVVRSKTPREIAKEQAIKKMKEIKERNKKEKTAAKAKQVGSKK